jgi:hypothetical protein
MIKRRDEIRGVSWNLKSFDDPSSVPNSSISSSSCTVTLAGMLRNVLLFQGEIEEMMLKQKMFGRMMKELSFFFLYFFLYFFLSYFLFLFLLLFF